MADQYLDIVAAKRPLPSATAEAEDTQPVKAKLGDGRLQRALQLPQDKRPRRIASIAGCSLILLVVVWLMAGNYASKFRLGGQLVAAHISTAALQQDIESAAQQYRLAIAYPSGATKRFTLRSAGLEAQAAATVQTLRDEQGSLLNRLFWWRPMPTKLMLSTNSATLSSFIASHADMTVAPAKDASLTITNGAVQVAAAVAGKQYGLTNAAHVIQAEAAALNVTPLVLKTVALAPTLTTAELAVPEATVKQVLAEHIAFLVDGQTSSPSPSDIASWLTLTPDTAKKTVDISVNTASLTAYIDNLASNADRPARDQVSITDASGGTSVAVQGQEGVTVTGQQAAATTVAQGLLAGKALQVSLPSTKSPYGSITAGNWSKWIEVDLTTKRMYAFQYGSVVNTFLVSAGKPSTPTPTGQFAIWDKLTSQTMVGPGYVQPNVPWVNYFDHSGDAIHGNYWRAASVFGSENTSHGCVGLQVAPAEWVYDWAPIGTPVIIHD